MVEGGRWNEKFHKWEKDYRGARKKEGLKLYLVPEINSAAKLQNANTSKLAEQIKAQCIFDIQQQGIVNWEDVKKSRMTLSAWVEQYLLHIGKPDLALTEVDKDFCKGFIAFLKTCTFNNGKKTLGTAILQLPFTLGADLYTMNKILGHGSIASTQVYVSVNMEKKTEAVNLTNGIFMPASYFFGAS